MKKLSILAFAFLLCGVNVMAKGKSPVSVTSGSLDFAKKGGTATVAFDYSGLQVNGLPLEDFLASKDEKFNNDWESVIVPGAETAFIGFCTAYLNKGNFMAYKEGGDTPATAYKLVLHLTSLSLGNAGQMYNPFSGMKAGGAVISGSLDCIDSQTGETVCVVTFDNLQGTPAYSDRDRWIMAYYYLMNKNLKKLAK